MHYIKIWLEFEFGGKVQRARSQGQKNEKVWHFVRESSCGAHCSCGIFVGSGLRGLDYAGGKISACCL